MKTGPFAKLSLPILRKILIIAIPSTLQQSFISVGNIIIQGVINGFGPGVMAGYSAAIKLNNLVITSLTTMGNGISNYTAQNLGAIKPDRVRAGFRAGMKMMLTLVVPLILLYTLAGRYLLLFFMKEPTEGAIRSGLMFLRIVAPFYILPPIKMSADGVLKGGSQMGGFMVATFTDLVLRVVPAILLSRTPLGSTGIWCAWPLGWFVATLISVHYYKTEGWNKKVV